MFDRRSGWVTLNAFLFKATYMDERVLEIQVNPEFETSEAARVEALRFAPPIGQLPRSLLRDVETVWIHKDVFPFGGGNNNLLIHTGQADLYLDEGILEEVLVHESAHTSLDNDHAETPEWLRAQADDEEFISTYARDNPNREDIAESFLLWLALDHRADRISESLKQTIEDTIPHRIAYFQQQNFDLFPIVIPEKPPKLKDYHFDINSRTFRLSWISRLDSKYAIDSSTNLQNWEELQVAIQSQGSFTEVNGSLIDLQENVFLRVREETE